MSAVLEALEAQVLGIAMSRADGLEVLGDLGVEDFATARCRAVWEAIAALTAAGRSCDALSVAEKLGKNLETLGGLVWLGGLASEASGFPPAQYADALRQHAFERRLSTAARQIEAIATEDANSVQKLAMAQAQLDTVSTLSEAADGAQPISRYIDLATTEIDARAASGGLSGLSTGLDHLDRLGVSLDRGDLTLLAARPSMGKSALAMAIATSVAKRGKTVLVASLEMSATQLAERMISNDSGVAFQRLRLGAVNAEDWHHITESLTRLRPLPMWIDEAAIRRPASLSIAARHLARRQGLDLVVVDYLQLMYGDTPDKNRVQEMSSISRAMKLLAGELHVPVLALSQLNRGLEQRADKHPKLSDLRESGSLEQDADIVMMLYRDEVYAEDGPLKGYAELDVVKQRHGPLGKAWLQFDGAHMRFSSCDAPHIEPRRQRPPPSMGDRWGARHD